MNDKNQFDAHAITNSFEKPSRMVLMNPGPVVVDERVRQEGYDIELMAARQLGEAPSGVRSPFAPALVTGISEPTPPPPPPPASPMPTGSVLGLG